jgi:hypothetical protein
MNNREKEIFGETILDEPDMQPKMTPRTEM